MKLYTRMLLEKADDGEGGGAPKSEAEPKSDMSKDDPSSEGEGNQLDDFGYEIPKEEGDKKPEGKEGKKPEVQKEEPTKVENPATGYGDEPAKVEDKKEEEPPAKEEEIDLGYEVKVEGLPKDEVKGLKEFFKKNEVPEKVAQAFIEKRKSEIAQQEKAKADQEKAYEAERQKIRSDWHKELKSDPTFGGEKFGHNVLRAEKVIEEFMPNTKKRLTETKAMLPPYVMRDLVKLADQLYSTEKLVQGDPSAPDVENEKGDDDPLAFYNT